MVLPLLIAGLLAGCATPGEDDPDSAFGACPHWVQRDPPLQATLALDQNETQTNVMVPADAHGNTVLHHNGHPFDMVLVRVLAVGDGNGTLVLNATSADGRDLLVYDHKASSGPRAVVEARLAPGEDHAGRRYSVYLSSVSQTDAPEPGPIHLTWRGEGGPVDATIEVSYWDRVCGVAA